MAILLKFNFLWKCKNLFIWSLKNVPFGILKIKVSNFELEQMSCFTKKTPN